MHAHCSALPISDGLILLSRGHSNENDSQRTTTPEMQDG